MNDPRRSDEPPLALDDFLSGTSGLVFGKRATARALVADAVADVWARLQRQPGELRRAAAVWPARRRILALAVERDDAPNLLGEARQELQRSRHAVTFASHAVAGRGKFENLNLLLAENPPNGYDWLLALDDDVALPQDFLDLFVFLIERFGLRLAQPSHRARSHAAWKVTRRRPGSLVRETNYVESGPLVAFHATTFGVLLPFPDLRVGWGLDAHWSALARERGWPIGIVDATPVRHGLRQIAAAYDRTDAIAEGRRFLANRPYVRASEAQLTRVIHRKLP
jgi:hypothetical protein